MPDSSTRGEPTRRRDHVTQSDSHAGRSVRPFSPRELMMSRHPELFSDSTVEELNRFPKESFEYYLDTLTSRKQEYQFEYFCRKLAESTICPNLRVQTGPTGGGDSKVDTETYPVSDEIAERWWVGASGSERWAFAFSAKKGWKSKIQSDVKGIVSTRRRYRRIYFFTNQFVSDKARAATEDDLSKSVNLPVHIVDRAWIVEKVYSSNNRALRMYLAALGVEGGPREDVTDMGPRDSERHRELEVLEQQIGDPSRYDNARYQLAEDCLRAATLSRNLECSRVEVDGRFERADRISREVGHPQQQLRIAYSRAWTAFWWYEDYAEFLDMYSRVERLARRSALASDVELLMNLWLLLRPSFISGKIHGKDAMVKTRSEAIDAMLQRMVDDPTRPNNSLHARTNLILMNTVKSFYSKNVEETESGWRALSQVTDHAEGLGEYSVERLFGVVRELGEYVDGPEFDALYEKLADVTRVRRSEGSAGLAYLIRALQKLRQDKPYQAIAWFGRAEELLFKEEYRSELISSLLGISCAFERAGLRWAARHSALAAANRALVTFNEEGRLTPDALAALNRLAWSEIALGRVPHALNSMVLARSIASQITLSDHQGETYSEHLQLQEMILGIHLLRAPLEVLPKLARLPDALERIGFPLAKMALLFSLGHETTMRDDGFIPEGESEEDVRAFFDRWLDAPASSEIASTALFFEGPDSVFRSTILGSDIVIRAPNDYVSHGLSECILGALEAFVATSDERDVMPRAEEFGIIIAEKKQRVGAAPEVTVSDEDSRCVQIFCPPDFEEFACGKPDEYTEWLRNTLITITCRILVIHDVEGWTRRVAGHERGVSRALVLANVFVLNGSVFGGSKLNKLETWLEEKDVEYRLLRKTPWHDGRKAKTQVRPALRNGRDEEDGDRVFDREMWRHSDRLVVSVIDLDLWDRAQWMGALFVCAPSEPPILGLGFVNGEAGESIFRKWKERWGNADTEEQLRLSIVTKISKNSPLEYAVVIGPSVRQNEEDLGKLILGVSRHHRMTPRTSENLNRFIESYRRAGRFWLAPARISVRDETFQKPSMDLAIRKEQLSVREAWEIGEHDQDRVVIREGDDPILPSEQM